MKICFGDLNAVVLNIFKTKTKTIVLPSVIETGGYKISYKK